MIAKLKSKAKPTATLTPAVGYIRMSSDKQEASPAQQRTEVNKLAARLGYTIVRWYEDLAISGAETNKRKAFVAMIADAEKRGDFKAILCWDQDRFGRFDSIEAGAWIAPLRKAGVQLVTVAQGAIDWTSFAGRMIYSIQQEGKNQYLVDLSRNVLRGQATKAKAGKWVSGIAYGYDRQFYNESGEPTYRAKMGDNSRKPSTWAAVLVLSEDAQAVATVRWLFETYASRDCSVRWLAGELNRRGIPSPRSKVHWTNHTVGYILRNRTYIGEMSYGKIAHGKFHTINGDCEIVAMGKPGVRRDAPIVTKDAHEAIIDRKLFDRVQRKLEARVKNDRRPSSSSFLLSGIARCGMCGGPLAGMINKPREKEYRYYVCGKHATRRHCIPFHVDAGLLERKLIDALQEKIFCADDMARLTAAIGRQAKSMAKGGNHDQDGVARQIAKLDQQIARGTENLLLAAPADVAAASKLLDAWRRQRDELATGLKSRPEAHDDADTLTRRALQAATDLRARLADDDPLVVRNALASVFSKVTVWVQTEGRRHHLSRGLAEFASVEGLSNHFKATDQNADAIYLDFSRGNRTSPPSPDVAHLANAV